MSDAHSPQRLDVPQPMFEAGELRAAQREPDVPDTTQRLLLFMGTRLGVATLLLGGTLLLALENARGAESFTPRFLMALIAAIYAGSIVSSVWIIGSPRHAQVALVQMVGDLLVTTALVYITGGAGSGFTFLYGVAVLFAAMVIGPGTARWAGAAALLLFTALIVSLSMSWLPPPPDQPIDAYRMSAIDLTYATLLNVLGLCLVTLLASGLAARLSSAGGQLKLAEASAAGLARLNADILRSLTSGLLTTDLSGRIRTVNPAGVEMLGAEPFALIGEPVNRFLPIDIAALEALSSAGQEEIGKNRAEGDASRPDGTHFPVGYSLTALNDVSGQLLGGLIMFQDLSEIVQLREAAMRGDRLAVLGRLSAGLAHEIRNPLSSISGSVELVRGGAALDEDDRRLLGIVLREVERLDDLVTTMLLVGRPREPLRREHDLRLIVTEVVEIARRGPGSDAGVTIQGELPDGPVLAWVDGDQVRQVLWNLVKNALQASPRGTIVRVRASSAPPDAAVIEVIDQGRGIDATQREKIYDMFHSERTHGAGIGLALVRQIIDAHRGSIDIVSEQHRGATFVVTLPAHRDAQIEQTQRKLISHPPAA